jgi:hypothetical protein
MTAIGATRDNLLQQRSNLERRRAELKAALGIRTRGQHKNLKLRLNKKGEAKYRRHPQPELLREYVVTGESINRINEELRNLKDSEEEAA